MYNYTVSMRSLLEYIIDTDSTLKPRKNYKGFIHTCIYNIYYNICKSLHQVYTIYLSKQDKKTKPQSVCLMLKPVSFRPGDLKPENPTGKQQTEMKAERVFIRVAGAEKAAFGSPRSKDRRPARVGRGADSAQTRGFGGRGRALGNSSGPKSPCFPDSGIHGNGSVPRL